jgi:hypothetical protein
MSYTINLTNGNVFAVIPDGTINTSSSMTLIGKNYAGYGDFLDENFVHLLENSANSTAPGAPLTGQLWWDSSNGLLKVYNGTTFKTISAATSSSTAPTSNVTGDLWYDTVNQQLKVYTGSVWLLVGPQFTAGQGVTGAVVDTITDNLNQTHTVIKLYVSDSVVGIVSKDATFTPSPAISGFGNGVMPGITLASSISSIPQLFQGTATSAQGLISGNTVYTPSDFIPSIGNATMTGTLAILNNSGLAVGVNQDFRVSVSGTAVTLANQTTNGNIAFRVSIAGVPTTVMTINGSTGAISGQQITANYADVAERFASDTEYEAGTVVELGGSQEITRSNEDLSDKVFGVISTRAAYLMNGNAGTDATHPPVAMTGRVPVRVVGIVRKGDRLVSAGNGLARSAQAGEITAFNVIGRSLVDKLDSNEGMVEAIVTIK